MNKKLTEELLKMKKVRLIEDKISYEDLAIMDIWSEDEMTFELTKMCQKEDKNKITLKKSRRLE